MDSKTRNTTEEFLESHAIEPEVHQIILIPRIKGN